MRGVQIEVVPRPIKIHGKQVNSVEPVLRPIRLCLYEHHLFRQAIRSVCLFGIAVPQLILFKWHRRKLRIGANAPYGDELFNTELSGILHHLNSHDGVVVKKTSRICAVRANAPYYGREVNDDFGSRFRVKPNDGIAIAKVILIGAWCDYVFAATLP